MSKLKKIGYVSLGVLLGASLTVSVPAIAATAKTIQAKINSSVSVVVDGKKMSTQPINYQNLNYLPVGEIGRALDADVSFDKSKNVISIESKKSATVDSGNTGNTGNGNTTTPVTETSAQSTIPTVKAGESITAKGVTVSIDKIEYVTDEEEIDGIFLPKGFKAYITLTNNSDDLIRLGSTYYYDTGKLLQNKNINSLGNIVFVEVDGKEYLGSTISKGQTARGFIYSQFNQDVNIKTIKYAPSVAGYTSHEYIGEWTFE
ncbi:hypothetical protein [Paenibacillus sp. QZ-Y1]|uniref:hypothetical protein n=1 Tax=Paenibacillus sp. QZ-Y1 TaxID=3414511 RepID=UPI003F79750F